MEVGRRHVRRLPGISLAGHLSRTWPEVRCAARRGPQSLSTSHLSHLNKDYIKETAKPSIRADAIGATASQAFVAGSYRSTELRRPMPPLKPPTA